MATMAPFAPLGGEIQQSEFRASEPPPSTTQSVIQTDTTPPEGIAPQNQPGLIDHAALEKKQRDLEAQVKQQSSFWPTFLATAAALNGNFGPAIQLQNQKRVTQLGVMAMPHIAEINELANTGKWEQAAAQAETVMASIGSRAPELVPVFQGLLSRISEKQKTFENLKSVYEAAKLQLNENSSESQKKAVQGLGNLVKNRSYIAEASLNNLLTRNQLHTQVVNNQIVTSSPATGETRVTPMPTRTQPSDVEDIPGYLLSYKWGMTPAQIADIVSSKEVQEGGGSPRDQAIFQNYVSLGPSRARGAATKLIPYEPRLATQMRQNVDVIDMAVGKVPGTSIRDALDDETARKVREAAEPYLEIERRSRLKPKEAGLVPIIANPNRSDFLTRVPGTLSIDMMERLGPDAVFVDRADEEKILKPINLATKGLDEILTFQAQYPGAEGPIKRLDIASQRWLSRMLGTKLAGIDTVGEAAAMLTNRALERVTETDALKIPDIGYLKSLLTGGFASPQEALDAAIYVQKRLKEEMSTVLGPLVRDYKTGLEQYKAWQEQQAPQGQKGSAPLPPGYGLAPGGLKQQELPAWMKNIQKKHNRFQGLERE